LIPFSYFAEQFRRAFLLFHTWSIELTRAAQLGIKWILMRCN
jgi:hypothetical protein